MTLSLSLEHQDLEWYRAIFGCVLPLMKKTLHGKKNNPYYKTDVTCMTTFPFNRMGPELK